MSRVAPHHLRQIHQQQQNAAQKQQQQCATMASKEHCENSADLASQETLRRKSIATLHDPHVLLASQITPT